MIKKFFAVVFGLWLGIFGLVHVQGADSSPAAKKRVLLVTGIDYPGHLWRETSPVLAEALRQDKRLQLFTIEDPSFLDSAAINRYDLVILHFQNWEQPGPGPAARENLLNFVQGGKGLALVHFACGAWHGEWPDFEKIAGRVWFGPNPGPGKRQHDPFGPFRVEFPDPENEIVKGMEPIQTEDELYTCLTGSHPIKIVAQAKSKVDNEFYPMAFTSTFGAGRTFHSVLGHDTKALSARGVQELYRRGCAWAAGLPPAK